MIPRSLKLDESERKYKRVLEKRKKLQALSKTRRDGLLQLVEDCLSGKQKMFGGRFAKPARRNKIILDKISSIETNVLDDEIGNNVKMMENGESPVKKYAEAMNSISSNKKNENGNQLYSASNDDDNAASINQDVKYDRSLNQGLFREEFKSLLQPSLLKKINLSKTATKLSLSPAVASTSIDKNDDEIKKNAEETKKKEKTDSTTSTTNEPLVDLCAAGIEINGAYYSGRVQAYTGNFKTRFPVMGVVTLENIDDPTSLENSICWFEIPNILHNVSDKKMLGQNILKSIDVTINNDTGLPEEIVFDKEKCILFCEFL